MLGWGSQVKSSQVKEPIRHLRPLPSTTAGLRSTFDRLPYGCLLFMYRLDLRLGKGRGQKLVATGNKVGKGLRSRVHTRRERSLYLGSVGSPN